MTLALLCVGLLAGFPESDPPAPPDVTRAYQEARARAGKSSPDQVRLALWCEAHGLTSERLNHLALAVLSDPTNATARGLMGLVAYNGRFQRPEAVAASTQASPVLAEYDAKRSKAPYTAEGQWLMGVWAEDRGLKDQARAHFTAVIRLDPSREHAWKRLGYKKLEGRWITEGQATAQKAELEAQKQADKKWKPVLERYRAMLEQPSKREEAESALDAIKDPRAVPMVVRIFGATEALEPIAVRLLGQIDALGSSRALAHLAVAARSLGARRAATETLHGRDPREYANILIAMIRDPIKFEVKPIGGPGSPGVLYVEGQKANLKRIYSPTSAFQPGDTVTTDQFGQPVLRRMLDFQAYSKWGNPFNPNVLLGAYRSYDDLYSSVAYGTGNLSYPASRPSYDPAALAYLKAGHLPKAQAPLHQILPVGGSGFVSSTSSSVGFSVADLATPRDFARRTDAEIPLAQAVGETIKADLSSRKQLESDVANLEATNRAVIEVNERVVGILNSATDQSLPALRAPWERWWVDTLGYAQVASRTVQNPTIVEVIPSGYQPQLNPSNIITQRLMVNGISCFGAGTLVRTMAGPRPIETLQVGDTVLTQNITTGALGYQPILVVHHNPPSRTFRIQLQGDSIISSHFHRFWVAGKGWVMARDLKVGDPIRTLGGVLPVEAVEADSVQLVYNLDVAEDADFFAGASAALVHDNTLPDPRLVPFDIVRREE